MADLAFRASAVRNEPLINTQLPRREDVRIGSTKSPVTRNFAKNRDELRGDLLIRGSGTRHRLHH
jgi:hypothetical protein